MRSIVIFSTFVILIVALRNRQNWPIDSDEDSEEWMGSSYDGSGYNEGPSFLKNIKKQGKQEYNKIMKNKALTKAQIQTALGNWAVKYNVASQVSEYNSKKQLKKTQFRSNVTSAVQQLPNLFAQMNSIEDNQNLTPTESDQQISQTIRNASPQLLRNAASDLTPPVTIVTVTSEADGSDGIYVSGDMVRASYEAFEHVFRGPPFLKNLNKQGKQDYYKIMKDKALTRAQIKDALGNWAGKYKVASQVKEYYSNKQSKKSQFRSDVTVVLQKLPNLISQLNAIEDNQNLTPSQTVEQTRQAIRNASPQELRSVILELIPESDDDDENSY